jgi:hypothetical protein
LAYRLTKIVNFSPDELGFVFWRFQLFTFLIVITILLLTKIQFHSNFSPGFGFHSFTKEFGIVVINEWNMPSAFEAVVISVIVLVRLTHLYAIKRSLQNTR